MENKEQKYCVVATDRNSGNRKMLTGAMSESSAYTASQQMQLSRLDKKLYKYFKVAKYPYKQR